MGGKRKRGWISLHLKRYSFSTTMQTHTKRCSKFLENSMVTILPSRFEENLCTCTRATHAHTHTHTHTHTLSHTHNNAHNVHTHNAPTQHTPTHTRTQHTNTHTHTHNHHQQQHTHTQTHTHSLSSLFSSNSLSVSLSLLSPLSHARNNLTPANYSVSRRCFLCSYRSRECLL